MTPNQDIPGMNLDKKYSKTPPAIPQNMEKVQKEMDKTKKELDKFKNFVLKKYPFTQALSILPPQTMELFVKEEEIPKETEKYIQLYMVIPEEKFKEIPKIKPEVVKKLDEVQKSLKQKIWLQIKTPVDVWELCLDSKFELSGAIAMSFPIHDTGFLGALRVSEIHKSLVLQKFEKYVVSYVVGGSLVRGEAVETSDVDVFIIINDTDVKRMPRLELKERLRGIIHQYVNEASALAGVQNKLSPQVYLLTDFWESVKDAHPVMFTFIRDGIPLYDRGTFMPWKALLKMGKLKPSPEAIEAFMSIGDNTIQRSKKTLLSGIFVDIFWGVTTPAQAIVMLNGLPPPNAKKELVPIFRKHFQEKKMIEKKYVDFLDKVVKIWRDYEHEKIKEISGTEIDKLLKGAEDCIKRFKELRKQIDKKAQEKTIEEIYKDVFSLLKSIFGTKAKNKLILDFEKFVKEGKFTSQHLRILKDIDSARQEFKKGKSDSHKINEARKNASILMSDLIEYSQRCDMASLEKGKMNLKYMDNEEEKIAELIFCDGVSFLVKGNDIKKLTSKIEKSDLDEFSKAIENQKNKENIEINPKIFELVKKELGDYEIIL